MQFTNRASSTAVCLTSTITSEGPHVTARIAVASDLHLNETKLPAFEHRNAVVIVLAGDIDVSPQRVQTFIATLPSATPKLLILGNHEYDAWDSPALGIAESLYRAQIATVSNAFLLERERFEFGEVTFLGATLWSDFERGKGVDAARFITRTIVADPRELVATHRQTVAWLKREIAAVIRAKRKPVIVTHMAPSYRSLSADERRQPLAGFFASNLDDFIRELRPTVWIHGHIHTTLEYPLGATTIVANPRGYPGEKPTTGRTWAPKIVAV